MKRTSLKDIASALGISTASVSIVLNNKDSLGRVSYETATKIRNKAKELNYSPNAFAKSLRLGKSKTIALVIADVSNIFFGKLAFFVQTFAEQYGYTVIIANTNEDASKMDKLLETLKSRQVDGFIITPPENSELMIQHLLVEENYPTVLVDRSFPNIPVNSVLIDNYSVSYRGTKYLIDEGCQQIAFIAYKQNLNHIKSRRQGYIDAMKYFHLYKNSYIKEVRYNTLQEDMEQAISELFNSKEKVDSIFFATNTISICGIRCLLNKKIQISQDLKLMCFDENEAFSLLPFPIPYIKQPIEKMAHASVELLIDQIKAKTEIIHRTLDVDFALHKNK